MSPLPPPDGYRDETGAIRRQAARFRIYGYDAEGRVVRELTAADATITWTAHLVNRPTRSTASTAPFWNRSCNSRAPASTANEPSRHPIEKVRFGRGRSAVKPRYGPTVGLNPTRATTP
ncbi:MAG: LodA/GoxA family CTQ-dependent oxidase [Gemmatimonadota bacterium]